MNDTTGRLIAGSILLLAVSVLAVGFLGNGRYVAAGPSSLDAPAYRLDSRTGQLWLTVLGLDSNRWMSRADIEGLPFPESVQRNDEIEKLRAGGFSEIEIREWLESEKLKGLDQG